MGTCSPEMHTESQVAYHAIRHEDAGKIEDLAQRQVDMERKCHHANMVHKDQCLALQKLWDLNTGTEAEEMSVGLGRNNVALCCSVAEASGSKLSPSRERN